MDTYIGCGPLLASEIARVAQWIERWTSNPKVAGSSPAVGNFGHKRETCSNRLPDKLAWLSWLSG